jgi:predicted O-methyltransferase YrrM
MATRTLSLTDQIHAYLVSISGPQNEAQRRLREETGKMPNSGMQISFEQGQLMALLVRLLKARKTLEVGVFTGYSSLVVAQALPEDGKVIACDVSEEFTAIARRHWEEAGVAHKIDLRLAPAIQTLDALLAEGHADTFDFAFIDADKSNYDAYYERALKLIHSGGLIAIDNTLWAGKVADESVQDHDTQAMRAFNAKLHHDARIYLSVVPIGDGLTLVMRRK